MILDSFFFGLVSFSQLLITLLCNMWKTELSWLRFFYVKSGLLFQKSLFLCSSELIYWGNHVCTSSADEVWLVMVMDITVW